MKRALALVLLATACSSGGAATPASPEAPVRARAVSAAALVPYGDCRQLLQRVRREALAETTAYGLAPQVQGRVGFAGPVPMAAAATGALTDRAAMKSADSFSGTTVQEAGVDELDRVKTDGRLMAVVAGHVVRLLDVADQPVLQGTVSVRADLQDPQLLLMDDRLLVVGTRYAGGHPMTRVQVVDVSDLAAPVEVRAFDLQGSLVDARTLRGRVLLATHDVPTVPVYHPRAGTAAEQRHALLVNRRRVAAAPVEQWLPSIASSPSGAETRASCSQVLHPPLPSGVGTTQLVTLDPAQDTPTETVTVVGGTTSLYASTDAVYLATSTAPWFRAAMVRAPGGRPAPATVTTDLHGFDVTDPDALVGLGSGSVPGTLLDQYALSESGGVLRVATTTVDGTSQGRVTTLRPRDGVLAEVGHLDGLGKGERIVGVRFLGDRGYVVTFRQTDPLFVVDLSDPEAPRLRGSLELPGFSSTLFPLSDGRLLGIGPSGAGGTQLSVFDVEDADAPRLVRRTDLPGAWTEAAQDHHALLWWAPESLVVLPVQDRGALSARAFRLGDAGLDEAGTWTAPTRQPLDRSVVVGDLLYSVGTTGVTTRRLDDLGRQAEWLPFG